MKDVASIRKRNLRAWVKVDDEVSILARYLGQAEYEELKAQTVTVELNPGTSQTEAKEDMAAFRKLIGNAVVQDIVGLEDSEDKDEAGNPKPFAVTSENIALLMEEWTEFRLTVLGTPMSFERMWALAQEQSTKK